MGTCQIVQLRPVHADDLPAFFEFQCDPDANRMAVANPRDAESFEAHWADALSDPTVVARAIVVDGALAGYISCFRADDLDMVGYWIDRSQWGRGIATAALERLLADVTNRPVYARVARTNLASVRVLEKCGFELDSVRMSPESDRFPACEEVLMRRSH